MNNTYTIKFRLQSGRYQVEVVNARSSGHAKAILDRKYGPVAIVKALRIPTDEQTARRMGYTV